MSPEWLGLLLWLLPLLLLLLLQLQRRKSHWKDSLDVCEHL